MKSSYDITIHIIKKILLYYSELFKKIQTCNFVTHFLDLNF